MPSSQSIHNIWPTVSFSRESYKEKHVILGLEVVLFSRVDKTKSGILVHVFCLQMFRGWEGKGKTGDTHTKLLLPFVNEVIRKLTVLGTWQTKQHADLFSSYQANTACICLWLLALTPKGEILNQFSYTGRDLVSG